jgi:hypothetical protein
VPEVLTMLRLAHIHSPPLDAAVLRVQIIIDPVDMAKPAFALKPYSYSMDVSFGVFYIAPNWSAFWGSAKADRFTPRGSL